MSKSIDAFRTIGEVASELGVPKHVLRFWEAKFPHIRPMKRGGGRRYYRPEDLELLRGIRHLLHAQGYTIKGVQKILRENGVDAVKEAARATQLPAHDKARKGRKADQTAAPVKSDPASTKNTTKTAAEVIAAAIRELEACREKLVSVQSRGNVAAVPGHGQRARAGGG